MNKIKKRNNRTKKTKLCEETGKTFVTMPFGVWGDITFEVSDKPIKDGTKFVLIDFSR